MVSYNTYGGEVSLYQDSYTPTKIKDIKQISGNKGYISFSKPVLITLDNIIELYGCAVSANNGRYIVVENIDAPMNSNYIVVKKLSGNISDEISSSGFMKDVVFPWKIKIMPILIYLPNKEVVYKNYSTLIDLEKYAVDIEDSFRKVIIYFNVKTKDIEVFGDIITRVERNTTSTYVLYNNAYIKINPNTSENPKIDYGFLDIKDYPVLQDKDIVVLADVFITHKQRGLQNDNVSLERRGFFVPSSTSLFDKYNVTRETVSNNIRYWNYLIPNDLRGLGDSYQVFDKQSSIPKRIAESSRSGMMSYIEYGGDKYLGFNGPHACSAADTLCAVKDTFCDASIDVCSMNPSCSPSCDTTDTTCASDDWSVLRLNDGCDDACEVACQVACQAAIQTSTCFVNCECGHEYTTYNPKADGCPACEVSCQSEDARSDHRCYWYVETPGSNNYIECHDCDTNSDPHNLASCVSCDVELDTRCIIGVDAYCYETCPVTTDIEIPWCKTQCEGIPACPTEYQNPCGSCEQNEWQICYMGRGKKKGCIAPKTLQFYSYDDMGVDKKVGDAYIRTRKYSFYIDGKSDYVIATKLISTEPQIGDGGVVINGKWIFNVASLIPCVQQGDSIAVSGTSFDGNYIIDGYNAGKNQYYITSNNVASETPASASISIEENCIPTNEYNLRLWTGNMDGEYVKSIEVGLPGNDASYSYNNKASYTDYYFKVSDIAPVQNRLITITVEWRAMRAENATEIAGSMWGSFRALGAYTINLMPVCDPSLFITADYNEDMILVKRIERGGGELCITHDIHGREVPKL